MRVYHLAAFLALGFFQAAPLRSPGERFRLAVAGATGQWEDYQAAQFDCEGKQISPAQSSAVTASSVGARFDALSGDGKRRLSGVIGHSTSGGYTVGQGDFWGVEAGWEWRKFGLSVGYRRAGDGLLAGGPDSRSAAENLTYSVRGGRLEGTHYVVEWRPLSETPSLAGEMRAGLAYRRAGPRRPSGYVGLVLGSLRSSDDVRPAAFGDFGFPLFGSLDLLLRGVYGPGHGTPNWGVGLGVRATR